jgi:hypothetical protein
MRTVANALDQFVTEGRGTSVESFEHIFVPALLAASGRTAEARAALVEYQKRITPGSEEEKGYSMFRDRLSGSLG